MKERGNVERSKKVVFVPYCLLCQSIRAQGVSVRFPAIVVPVIELLMENDVNVIQMPCPEMEYEGITRKAARKDAYDTPEFRAFCGKYAKRVTDTIRNLRGAGFNILGVLGIENSPTCGVTYVFREGRGRVRESGVFIEELQKLLSKENLPKIPFLGIKIFAAERSVSELRDLISSRHE